MTENNNPISLPKKWQVFFLPNRELDSPTQVVAFCPHTGVEGIGKDIEEAKKNWIQNAEKKYKGKKFSIQKIKREKVWSGANEKVLQSSNEEVPVYVLPSQSEYVAVCPETKEVLSGKYEEWKLLDANRNKQTEFLPSLWSDQAVACSPLNDFEKSSENIQGTNQNGKQATCYLMRNDYQIQSPFRSNLKINQWICGITKSGTTENSFECKKGPHAIEWSEGSKKILKSENAGGNSIYSEAASCQILEGILNCKLRKTEMEIEYYPYGGSITDYVLASDNKAGYENIGVSVTRAMKFRGIFTEKDAIQLLTKKLKGILCSTKNVMGKDKFKRQILHILTNEEYIKDVIERAYLGLSDEIKHDTLIISTTCKNSDWIFTTNPPPISVI